MEKTGGSFVSRKSNKVVEMWVDDRRFWEREQLSHCTCHFTFQHLTRVIIG